VANTRLSTDSCCVETSIAYFDLGYVTITPDHVFQVSTRIREEFENGRDYYALQGKPLTLPNRSELRPELAALDWHSTHRFLG
jgi:putative restriction endonuclease